MFQGALAVIDVIAVIAVAVVIAAGSAVCAPPVAEQPRFDGKAR